MTHIDLLHHLRLIEKLGMSMTILRNKTQLNDLFQSSKILSDQTHISIYYIIYLYIKYSLINNGLDINLEA